MHKRITYSCLTTLSLALAFTCLPVQAKFDAVAAASLSVSRVVVTTNTASITFSEKYDNGTLRYYSSATAFTTAADTSKAGVTKVTVKSPRGSGTYVVSNLTPNTTYYYRFQGWYSFGMTNYNATGSFKTLPTANGILERNHPMENGRTPSLDALGRIRFGASGFALDREGVTAVPRTDRK